MGRWLQGLLHKMAPAVGRMFRPQNRPIETQQLADTFDIVTLLIGVNDQYQPSWAAAGYNLDDGLIFGLPEAAIRQHAPLTKNLLHGFTGKISITQKFLLDSRPLIFQFVFSQESKLSFGPGIGENGPRR